MESMNIEKRTLADAITTLRGLASQHRAAASRLESECKELREQARWTDERADELYALLQKG